MIRSALLAGVLLISAASPGQTTPLRLANDTGHTILNILVRPATQHDFFMRLDLLPGARDEVDNPNCKASLRADTGLQFWTFPDIDLTKAKTLVFCAEHPICLLYEAKNGKNSHIAGKVTELAPPGHARPVCQLDSFHPSMPMKDVCAILPGEMARDDNGALLTGIGFAGMTWAARLVPAQNGPITENSLLEHLELRRPLSAADLTKLTDALFKLGYSPWQAEFPRLNIEFDPKADKERQKQVLLHAMQRFLVNQKIPGHKHGSGEKCEEASVILAPAKMLPALEKAEEPKADVQIYTIYIRPCAQTLLLDVAAYRAD